MNHWAKSEDELWWDILARHYARFLENLNDQSFLRARFNNGHVSCPERFEEEWHKQWSRRFLLRPALPTPELHNERLLKPSP